MRIGIYNSCLENRHIADISCAVIANDLAEKHQTEIIRFRNSSPAEHLQHVSGCSLEKVKIRLVADPPLTVTDPGIPDRRYQKWSNWSRELSRPYDLFINFADRLPVESFSPRGVLLIQFPHDFIPAHYAAVWRRHLASYQLRIANSYYTRFWTSMFWEQESSVVHPPVPTIRSSGNPENLIVTECSSAFARKGDFEKLLATFNLLKSDLPSWSFNLIVDGNEKSNRQVLHLEAVADERVRVIVNPNYEQRNAVLGRAAIYWQITGLGEELDHHPESVEPFNWRLVQAMSAGCVPIAVNNGGLAEVMRHEENGYFCRTREELFKYTSLLASNNGLRLQLAKAAHTRALDFRPEQFVSKLRAQLEIAFGLRARTRANPVWLWRSLTNRLGALMGSRH